MLRLCCRYPFSLTTSTSPHRTEAQPGPLLPCPRTCALGGVQQVISKQGRIRSLRDRLEAETRCSLIQSFSLPERTPARTVPSMTTRCCHEQVDGCLVTSLPPLCPGYFFLQLEFKRLGRRFHFDYFVPEPQEHATAPPGTGTSCSPN